MRTTVVSRPVREVWNEAGECDVSPVCGTDAARGSLWKGAMGPRGSGCSDDEGRCVTK